MSRYQFQNLLRGLERRLQLARPGNLLLQLPLDGGIANLLVLKHPIRVNGVSFSRLTPNFGLAFSITRSPDNLAWPAACR